MRTRQASVEWMGDLRDGGGSVSTASGVLSDRPYGFGTRLQDEPGTNPEELLAAAHASCYAMNLSMRLTKLGKPPEHLRVSAAITMRPGEDGVRLVKSDLHVRGLVGDVPQSTFVELAEEVARTCSVSRALNIDVTIDAGLEASA